MRKTSLLVVVVCAVLMLSSVGVCGKPGGNVSLNGVGSGKNVCAEMLRENIIYSGNPFDIAVDGQAFIVTNDGVGDIYSRDGSFIIGPDGYLTDPVTGYNVQRTGTIGEEGGFQQPGDMNIVIPYGMHIPGKATTSVTVRGHIAVTDMHVDATQQLYSPTRYTADGYGVPIALALVPASGSIGVLLPLPDKAVGDDLYISKATALGNFPMRGPIDPNRMNIMPFPNLQPIPRDFELARIVETKQFDGEFGDGATGKIIVSGIMRDGTAVTDDSGLAVDGETTFSQLMDHIEQVFDNQVIATCGVGEIRVADTVSGYSKLDMLLEYVQSEGGTDSFQVPDYFNVTVGGNYIWRDNLTIYGDDSTQVTLFFAFVKRESASMWDLVLERVSERFFCQPGNDSEQCQALAGWPVADGSVLIGFDAGIAGIPFDGRRIEGIEFNNDGSYAGMNEDIDDSPEFVFLTDDSDEPWSIAFNFGEEGMFTGLNQFAAPYSIFNLTQDGYSEGELVSSNIYAGGEIIGTSSNGLHLDLAKIKLVAFDNVCGLEMIDDRFYIATEESGQPLEGEADFREVYLHDYSQRERVSLRYHAYNELRLLEGIFDSVMESLEQSCVAIDIMLQEGGNDTKRSDLINTRQRIVSVMHDQEQAKENVTESVLMAEYILWPHSR